MPATRKPAARKPVARKPAAKKTTCRAGYDKNGRKLGAYQNFMQKTTKEMKKSTGYVAGKANNTEWSAIFDAAVYKWSLLTPAQKKKYA